MKIKNAEEKIVSLYDDTIVYFVSRFYEEFGRKPTIEELKAFGTTLTIKENTKVISENLSKLTFMEQ